MNIDIKNLKFIHPKLRKIALELEENSGLELTITSLYRIGDKGVHGQLPLRGMDVRVRDRVLGQELAKLVNDFWVYDDTREQHMCAIAHGDGANYHLHLQVHPRTKRKGF